MCVICSSPINSLQNSINVIVEDCSTIHTFPTLPNLRILSCSNCPNLKTIEPLPKLRSLTLNKCDSVRKLQRFPELMVLRCDDCPRLVKISKMHRMSNLYIKNCNLFELLGPQPSLRNAEFTQCSLVYSPMAPKLRGLSVTNCRKFTHMRPYSRLQDLTVISAPFLTYLPDLPALDTFYCRDVGICEIVDYPNLYSMIAYDLKNLTVISNIPRLRQLIIARAHMLTCISAPEDRVLTRDCPWVPNDDFDRNIKALTKIQRQIKVAIERRRYAKFITLKKQTPLPNDICRLISMM